MRKKTVRGYWRDVKTGKIYVIESDSFGNILGGAGPFEAGKLKSLNDYEYKSAIVEWLKGAVAKKKLHRIEPWG